MRGVQKCWVGQGIPSKSHAKPWFWIHALLKSALFTMDCDVPLTISMNVSASGTPGLSDLMNVSAFGAPGLSDLLNVSASGTPGPSDLLNVAWSELGGLTLWVGRVSLCVGYA